MAGRAEGDLSQLRTALAALEAVIERVHPATFHCLRPGLAPDAVEALAERLHPYHLPADVAELYRWHDGLAGGEPGVFVPQVFWGCGFVPLAFVFEVYAHDVELGAPEGAWSPAWFPVVGDSQFGELTTLEPRRSEAASLLWSYHFVGAEIEATYDSVLSLVTTTVALWEEGHFPCKYDEVDAGNALVARRNPACFRDGRWTERRHRCEGTLSDSWLPEWKESFGWHGTTGPPPDPVPIDQVPDGAFDEPIPVRGVLRGRGGGGGWSLVEITDATGSVLARISAEHTDGYRFLHMSDVITVWVVRLVEDPSDAPPAGEEPLDPAAAAVERVVARWREALIGVRIAPVLP